MKFQTKTVGWAAHRAARIAMKRHQVRFSHTATHNPLNGGKLKMATQDIVKCQTKYGMVVACDNLQILVATRIHISHTIKRDEL